MLLLKKHTITWETLLFLEDENILSALQNEAAVILKWFQPPCWAVSLHFTLALSSFSAALVSVPFLLFSTLLKALPPYASQEYVLCCTWTENISNISSALFLSQRDSERARERARANVSAKQHDSCWTVKPKCKGCSEVKHDIFKVSRLTPVPFGFEVVVRSAIVLRDPVRDSAVVLTLVLLLWGIWRTFSETLKLGHICQLSVAAKLTTSKLSGLYCTYYSQVCRPSGSSADWGQARLILTEFAHMFAVS